MKKTFLFAVILLCTLAIFVSCNSNDSEPEPEAEQVYPIDYIVIIDKDQTKYIDHSFAVNINGKSVSFKLEEMKETSITDYPLAKNKIDVYYQDSIKADPTKQYYNVYKYSVGKIVHKQKVYGENFIYTVKNDRPGTKYVNELLFYYFFNCSDKSATFTTYNDKILSEHHQKIANDFENLNGLLKTISESHKKESTRPSLEL